MKKPQIAIATAFIVAAVLLGAGWIVWSGNGSARAAMAEYQIEKLTCGSCVANIEKALDRVNGVKSVDVNLTSNRGRVIYDPSRITGNDIGQAITEAGYPARLRSELSTAEYRDMLSEQSQMSQKYVARIGDRLVMIDEFEAQVRRKVPEGDVPAAQLDRIRATAWQEVLQRELLLSAAERNNIVIQDGEIDLRIGEMSGGREGFEQLIVARFGSMQEFRELLRQELVINRHLEDHVFSGETSPLERQKIFQAWYSDLTRTTDVVIFDAQLKTASAKGGCGGGCCG